MSTVTTGLRRTVACCVACTVALSVTHVSAQPANLPTPQSDDATRPWAREVPEAEQETARALYLQGNAEFMESRFALALTKYREAIRHWDHPAIRFNMALCLINLDQLVEARDNLERSLVYGVEALGHDAYAQATTSRKLLDGQLAHVTVTCVEQGSMVTLDGKYLFTAPGSAKQDVLPGEHQLAATRPGFRTTFMAFVAVAGKRVTYDLRLTPEIDPPYWPYWKYVLGAGGALAAAGVATYLWARRDITSYDDLLAERCPRGCDAEMLRGLTEANDRKGAAMTKQAIAFTLFAVGGAAVLTGVLGLIIDEPHIRPASSRAVPVVGAIPGGATIALGWAF